MRLCVCSQPNLRSEDTGKHLLSADDLLQKHNLLEAQVNILGNRVRQVNKQAQPYSKSLHPETQLLQKRLEALNKDYQQYVATLYAVLSLADS